MKTLNLVLGITVTLGAEGLGGGSIESNLKAQGWKENEEFNAGVDMMAVSYTHLTLPTKRIV